MESWQSRAQGVLKQYDIFNPGLDFIRHNENLTCKVTDKTGNKYVLRIHQPIQGFSLDTAQHSYDALRAEMKFLRAIGENTDINVQRPVPNNNGNFVSQDGAVNATLLTWIEGQVMHHEDPNFAEEAYATGIMVAKLHNFAANWRPDPPLHRHSYGREKVQMISPVLAQGYELGLFGSREYELIQAGCAKICAMMDVLDLKPTATKGMIHADLSKSNLIVHDGGVTPIDFCLCGYGYFYMDLGGVSADFNPLKVRRQLLTGYRTVRDLPEEDIRYIEGFFVLSILLFMATHLHNPKTREWFGRRIPPICKDYILPLVEGRSFYESI